MSNCLRVIRFLAGASMDRPAESTRLKISGAESSGRILAMSSGESREKRPRSTHWRQAMVVNSLLQEAIQKVESSVRSFASCETPVFPKAFA